MPCRDYSDSYDTRPDPAIKAKLDMLSRIACKALQHIEETNDGLEMLILKDPEIAEWWSAHKEADRKEQERLRKVAEIASLRKSGLEKLTVKERKALGLK